METAFKQKLTPITLCLRKLGIKTQKNIDKGDGAFVAYKTAFERMKCNWYHTMPEKAQNMFRRLELNIFAANEHPNEGITTPFAIYKRGRCTSEAISLGVAGEFTIESKEKGWVTLTDR